MHVFDYVIIHNIQEACNAGKRRALQTPKRVRRYPMMTYSKTSNRCYYGTMEDAYLLDNQQKLDWLNFKKLNKKNKYILEDSENNNNNGNERSASNPPCNITSKDAAQKKKCYYDNIG